MYTDKITLTREGINKIEKELKHLKTVRRREVAKRLKQAIAYGDISDNSEYDDAKDEQAFIEKRILEQERLLNHAQVLNSEELTTDEVKVGNTVQVEDLETGEVFEYTIVSSAEADLSSNKISNKSPVGKGLLGKAPGDVAEISVPVGTLRYKIKSISV